MRNPETLIKHGPGWWECPLRAEAVYGFGYWEEYRRRDATPMGLALTAARLALLLKHCHGSVVDIGIGGGAFLVAARGHGREGYGADVNSHALAWLHRRGEQWDGREVEAMTFWDSIEHMEAEEIEIYLSKTQWAFVSTPIYPDVTAVLASKHFKPGEHLHYWSADGMVLFMQGLGFGLVEANQMETDLGREGIASFVFRKM